MFTMYIQYKDLTVSQTHMGRNMKGDVNEDWLKRGVVNEDCRLLQCDTV
jgi:hypothetical protein